VRGARGRTLWDSATVMQQLQAALRPTWDELWTVARDAGRARDQDARYVFEGIGLLLQPPDEPLPVTYEATPRQAITFASTGGDGVHFSAAHGISGAVIVMTVPMQFDRPNIAVGGTLREFLSLGCASGYFGLEQLAYDYTAAAAALAGRVPEDEEAEQELALLRKRLGLTPWPAPRSRLDELQSLLEGAS
jgi:hypothetical protein